MVTVFAPYSSPIILNALDVLCGQLTRDLFAIAKFLLTIGRLLLHCWYSLGRPVTIGTPMCLYGRPCVWLPFAAACCYTVFYLLMMPAARLVYQRPSSNFPYFRTQLANFLLFRPNSVEYGNSKTTIYIAALG